MKLIVDGSLSSYPANGWFLDFGPRSSPHDTETGNRSGAEAARRDRTADIRRFPEFQVAELQVIIPQFQIKLAIFVNLLRRTVRTRARMESHRIRRGAVERPEICFCLAQPWRRLLQKTTKCTLDRLKGTKLDITNQEQNRADFALPGAIPVCSLGLSRK